MLLFITIIFAQILMFNYNFDNTNIYQGSIILYAYLIVSTSQINILKFYVNFIKLLIQISLVFWIISVLFSLYGIEYQDFIPSSLLFPLNETSDVISHLTIHNFSSPEGNSESIIVRNSGMFWEPGAFAGIILFGFLFFILTLKEFSFKERKSILIWFIIGIVSTQSTTGYLLLLFLCFSYMLIINDKIKKIQILIMIIYLPCFIILFWSTYTQISFLGDKINEQILIISNKEIGWESTRIGTILFLTNIIVENPWIGIGFNIEAWKGTLISLNVTSKAQLGNGMFIFISKIGIPYFVIILLMSMYACYKATHSYIKSGIVISSLIILIQGESWYIFPIIYIFLFIDKSK